MGGTALPSPTLFGNFSTGKLSAALQALQTQGSMKLVTDGSVRLLNNQKGFIKVGDDKTFFSLSQTTSLSTTGATSGIGTGTQSFYTQERQTIGFVSPVTVYVGKDHRITLVLEPARTQLNGTDTSPDGTQTAPDINSSSIGTIVRLRDGESTILGGLVQTLNSGQTNGVPYLSSIPLVGQLAKTDATNNTRTELLITVSAHIIP
jgi:type II secretory pathway component GspD/PulD (secretin)